MKQMIDKVTGKVLSRSEAEAKIKDKAGWVITVVAALLAVTTYIGNSNSSKVLNNTIAANDTKINILSNQLYFVAVSLRQE